MRRLDDVTDTLITALIVIFESALLIFPDPCLYYISMFGASLLHLPMFYEFLASNNNYHTYSLKFMYTR